jgi:hypothetical protein
MSRVQTAKKLKQTKFIRELAKSGSIKLSCKAAGISKPSYYAWLRKDKDFLKQIEELLETIRREYRTELKTATREAVKVIIEKIHDSDSRVGLRAAETILESDFTMEQMQILQRLEKIERYVNQNETENGNKSDNHQA